MTISVIIPLHNRPREIEALLESLCRQSCRDFDVTVVEDGSTLPARDIADRFSDRLRLTYIERPNGGPGAARNTGAARAEGEMLIFLDSDTVLPEGYMAAAAASPHRFWGGPDRAASDFSRMQRAISHSMTSVLTTGGIRSRADGMDRFFPRSFNMGIDRELFMSLGGFSDMRYGEDIDLSYRVAESGCEPALLKEAWLYHRRRTDLASFFRQVQHSGEARIDLSLRHPGTLKAVHALPAAFTLGCAAALLGGLAFRWMWAALLVPGVIWAAEALRSEEPATAMLTAVTSYTQMWGYGTGFLKALLRRRREVTEAMRRGRN